jgi:hypothetical protein
MADNRAYICASYRSRACSNGVRIARKAIESAIIDPLREDLLDPARVQKMAAEMQRYYAERIKQRSDRAVFAPQEIRELIARIDRLRARLRAGDPDMASDEIQAAIEKAEA